MSFYGPEIDSYLRAERQARQAAAAATARNQQAVDSMNYVARQQAAKPWSEHQQHFDSFKQPPQPPLDDAKAHAQKHRKEFQTHLHRYRGPIEPLLELLEIKSKNPSKGEIRAAYRSAVKNHHPDLGGSEESFKQLSIAYELLMKRCSRVK